MATARDHIHQAELLIATAHQIADFPGDAYAQTITEAQVHATLANALLQLERHDKQEAPADPPARASQ